MPNHDILKVLHRVVNGAMSITDGCKAGECSTTKETDSILSSIREDKETLDKRLHSIITGETPT